MKLLPVLFALAFLPAMGQENARVISRVSDMAEGSEVDDIVWYQGESVTLDIKARRGNKPVAWPSSATSVLRVWKADAPGTLYVDKTNAFYAADATRNTLTPAQSNLGTNDYKFAVAVYDSTTFMGIAAEGDLEVRYAPQTGLPLVTPIAPTDNDTLGDLTPTAGRLVYGDGNTWQTLAAGTIGQVLTAQGAAAPSWSGAGAGDITAVAAGTGLSGGGTTGDLTLNLANTAVTAGSYGPLTGTVDSQGRLTAAATSSSAAIQSALGSVYLPLAGTEGRSVAWTNDGALFDLGNTEPSYIGTWRGGNGQVAFGVSINEIPWVWMENDNGFSFLSFRADDKLWITTDETNTTLVPLRASLSATDLLTGTVPDARFPAALPAISGANLTNLDASDLASGTVSDSVTAAKYRQPVISFSYRDLTWNTTAAAGWTGYEIESGSSGSKRTFGLDAITSAVATDQTGTFKTDWVPVPANFLAFKTTGAIKVTWVSSQAVVGESELRGIRLIGSSDLTGANATDLYTDTTTRDITTTGVPVTVSVNRSAFASTTVPAYICVQIDASVEDGDKLAIVSIEVLSE